MATRPSNIRMNVNATRAVSDRYAVSHDLMYRWQEKTSKIENHLVSFKEIKERHRIVENFTEIGSCTRDDLHEHWSPGRSVASANPCRRTVHSRYHTDSECLRRETRYVWRTQDRMVPY